MQYLKYIVCRSSKTPPRIFNFLTNLNNFMKQLLLAFVVSMLCVTVYGQRQCGSMDHLHHEIEQNPERAKILQDIESHTTNWIKLNSDNSQRAVVTIPVVFHVVYRTSSENISDAQLQSQLDVLTDDFRRLNFV